ncbi:hypothetical protein C8Q75DRAFT_581721 [Abortiporus biennis]|nr:hypothetical protein C8Q75DRAFT_581721 [Abortiporus biennis]
MSRPKSNDTKSSRGKTRKGIDFSNEHNSLVPIGRLTDDVLGEIFFHHVSTYFWRCSVSKAHKLSLSYEKHPLEPFSGLTNFYDWKNISQVCRRWWQVFNKSPRLFGFIVYKRLSWDFCQMMERASNNGAPVYIRFAEARITTSEMRQVRTMFGLIERTHLLRLDVPRRVYSCLESLEVNAKEWTHLHTISFSEGCPFPDEVDDPVSFFADTKIPKLCKVIGSQCSLGPIRSIIRPSVTHLSLERLYQDTTLLCLTEVLASLPRLKVLSLSHVVGGVPWSKKSKTWPGKTKLIKIPSLEHLTHLYVSSPITECAYILEYIKFPQDTVLELELHEETGDQYPSDIFKLALKQIDSRLQEIEFFPPIQPLTTFAGTPYRVRSPQGVQEWFKLQR